MIDNEGVMLYREVVREAVRKNISSYNAANSMLSQVAERTLGDQDLAAALLVASLEAAIQSEMNHQKEGANARRAQGN